MKGDVRLYSMSIIGQKPLTLLARFGFYLVHPSTFMHQNGGHATNDRHQDQIPGKNFRL